MFGVVVVVFECRHHMFSMIGFSARPRECLFLILARVSLHNVKKLPVSAKPSRCRSHPRLAANVRKFFTNETFARDLRRLDNLQMACRLSVFMWHPSQHNTTAEAKKTV